MLAQDIFGAGFSPAPKMSATGREQKPKTPVKAAIPKTGGALSGALSGDPAPNLTELSRILSGLSADDKAKLAAVLTGNGKGGKE